jgi:hypothetical protein
MLQVEVLLMKRPVERVRYEYSVCSVCCTVPVERVAVAIAVAIVAGQLRAAQQSPDRDKALIVGDGLHTLALAILEEGAGPSCVQLFEDSGEVCAVELEGSRKLLRELPHTVEELRKNWRAALFLPEVCTAA